MSILRKPRDYVDWYFKFHGITINPQGSLAKAGSAQLPQKLFKDMWLDYEEQLAAHNATAPQGQKIGLIRETSMEKAFEGLIDDGKVLAKKTLIESLTTTGSHLTPVEQFLQAVTGKVDPMEVAVVAHWCWQVKRKMLDKEVVDHLMPIFRGPQRSGKSTAAKKLFEPLAAYTLKRDFDQLTDNREYRSMGDNYIIFLDELDGAERSDMKTVKRLITAESLDYRPMRTNDTVKIPQSCSFIGCSNVPVNESLVDRTGMRRFAEIVTLDRCNWDLINGINYTDLWKGIDENLPCGYIGPHLTTLSAKQEELVTKDEITLFIEEYNLLPTNPLTIDDMPFHQVYDIYRSWCMSNGYKTDSAKWFGRKLVNRGLTVKQKKIAGRNVQVYRVNRDAAIPKLVGAQYAANC